MTAGNTAKRMRKAVLILLALVAAAPAAAALAQRGAADGTVTIEGARGQVVVQARGAVIGRLDAGTLEIVDLSPEDDSDPIVVGRAKERLKGGTHTWRGQKLSFRLIGGSYRVTLRGSGIDLSAVGRGFVQVRGEGAGLFSLTGDDCALAPERCAPLPDKLTRFELGERSDRERKSGSSLLAP